MHLSRFFFLSDPVAGRAPPPAPFSPFPPPVTKFRPAISSSPEIPVRPLQVRKVSFSFLLSRVAGQFFPLPGGHNGGGRVCSFFFSALQRSFLAVVLQRRLTVTSFFSPSSNSCPGSTGSPLYPLRMPVLPPCS